MRKNERNARNDNVIYVNASLQIEFETSEAFKEVEGHLTFRDYATGKGNFKQTFKNFLMSTSNGIILYREPRWWWKWTSG